MNERVQELEEAAKTRDRMILSLRKEMSELKAAKMHEELMRKQKAASDEALAKAKWLEKQANDAKNHARAGLHSLLQGDSRLMKPSPIHTWTPAGVGTLSEITVYATGAGS